MSGVARKVVLDATPLIYLAKTGLLPRFKDLPCEMLVPRGVVREVVDRGKEKGEPDAEVVGKALSDGVLRAREVSDPGFLKVLAAIRQMHPAEGEVLALAKEVGGVAVVDDRFARDVARAHGISFAGTAFLLAILVGSRRISREEARKAVDDMVRYGWRCSAEVYSKVIRMIEKA